MGMLTQVYEIIGRERVKHLQRRRTVWRVTKAEDASVNTFPREEYALLQRPVHLSALLWLGDSVHSFSDDAHAEAYVAFTSRLTRISTNKAMILDVFGMPQGRYADESVTPSLSIL